MNDHIQQAITIFNQGGIVIFPTDTAFGIGCRVDNKAAVEKVYAIRKRPLTQAASLLVSSLAMVKEYVIEVPSEVQTRLINQYWPGGLTIVLQSKKEMVPSLVRGGGETVGVRMPDHKDLLHVIAEVGVPILGPSANFHGENTPYTVKDLDSELIKQVDFILEGMCKHHMASTVIDCVSTPWKILREGAVKITV